MNGACLFMLHVGINESQLCLRSHFFQAWLANRNAQAPLNSSWEGQCPLDFDLLLRSGFFSPQMQAVVGLCMFGCRYVLKVLARPRHPSQKQKVKENKGSHDDSESCDPR